MTAWRATSFETRLKVLLSEGSSTSARQTLYALGRRYIVDLMDPAPLCQCRFSRFVRSWHRCPSFSKAPAAHLEFLTDLVRKNQYDVLLPTHEQVYLLSRFRDRLSRHVGLAVPEFGALKRMQSKAEFVRVMEEMGLPIPPTTIVRSAKQLRRKWDFPCYLKLAHSTAGNGVRLVRDPEHLRQVVDEFTRAGLLDENTEVVVQQPAEGTLSVVQAVFQHGELLGAHCAEALRIGIGGGLMARVSASHPVVVEQVRRLGRYLGWHGAIFLEYFYDATTREPRYIEANPRIGETVNAILSGLNLCEMLVSVSLGGKVIPAGPSKVGVRSHCGFLLLLAAGLEGANRRDLAKELWRAWTRRDYYENSRNEITRPGEDWQSLIPAMAVSVQLFASPRAAHRIVNKTVDNYCLSEAAVRKILALPNDCAGEEPIAPPRSSALAGAQATGGPVQRDQGRPC